MTSQQNIPIIVLQIIIISVLQIVSSEEQIEGLGGICLRFDNVSTTSVYYDNIDSLFSTFISNSPQSLFLQTSFGVGDSVVNGHYVCRPGVSFDTCSSCVTAGVKHFNENCSGKKEALAWYQQCMVRYTNQTIQATLQIEPSRSNWGSYNVSRPRTFPDLLNNTMEGIITEASKNKDHFSYNSTEFTAFEELFGMAWCVPDITENECESCLTTAFNTMIENSGLANWAYVLLPSCVLRYETAPFIFPESPSTLVRAPPAP